MPVPIGDGGGIITVGLKRGVGYRLRVTGILERPLAELFPVIEIVGHLHRPDGIDPGKYPIRVVFNQDDLDDAVDRGRLVTKVIYLEDPDQAIPFRMAKDQVPVVTLNPTEPPLRVASALGRPVAIVRIGRPPAHHRGNPGGSRRRHRPRLGREHRRQAVPVPLSERRAVLAAVRAGLRVVAPAGSTLVAARRVPLRRRRSRRLPAAPTQYRPHQRRRTARRGRPVRHRGQGASRRHASCPPTSSASTRLGSPRFA